MKRIKFNISRTLICFLLAKLNVGMLNAQPNTELASITITELPAWGEMGGMYGTNRRYKQC